MALTITRVFHKPDGGQTRTTVERHPHAGDGAQAKELLEKHVGNYPESGYDPEEGYWAKDTEGRRYTFSTTAST
jgi:hypothetical protein